MPAERVLVERCEGSLGSDVNEAMVARLPFRSFIEMTEHCLLTLADAEWLHLLSLMLI